MKVLLGCHCQNQWIPNKIVPRIEILKWFLSYKTQDHWKTGSFSSLFWLDQSALWKDAQSSPANWFLSKGAEEMVFNSSRHQTKSKTRMIPFYQRAAFFNMCSPSENRWLINDGLGECLASAVSPIAETLFVTSKLRRGKQPFYVKRTLWKQRLQR